MRAFLRTFGAAFLLAMAAPALLAQGEDYPSRPVRIIVPFSAGGPSDLLARLFAPEMSAFLGQPIIVENRVGASGAIGSEHVAKALPDGYTLLKINSATHGVPPALNPKLPYDYSRDFTYIGRTGLPALTLVATLGVPANSVAELIDYAKRNPGRVTFASPGNGTTGHLSGVWLSQLAGLDMVHVPYKGEGQALPDLISGVVHIGFFAGAKPQVVAGKLKALGVGPPYEVEAWPGVPPVARTVPGFAATGFQGLAGPAGLPKSVLNRLVAALNHALAVDLVKRRLLEIGYNHPGKQDPGEFTRAIAEEVARWKKVVADNRLKFD